MRAGAIVYTEQGCWHFCVSYSFQLLSRELADHFQDFIKDVADIKCNNTISSPSADYSVGGLRIR